MAHGAANRVAKLGLLLAAALVLYGVESALPSPFPFLRIGLANIVTIFVLLSMGFAEALVVTVLRVIIASLIVGTFLGPGFAMAAAGGLAGALAMGAAARVAHPPLGVVGVSLMGAAAHNVAQLCVVAGIYTGPSAAARLLPAALFIAVASGLGTGLVARFALEKLAPYGR